jgi:hypothetical protein
VGAVVVRIRKAVVGLLVVVVFGAAVDLRVVILGLAVVVVVVLPEFGWNIWDKSEILPFSISSLV